MLLVSTAGLNSLTYFKQIHTTHCSIKALIISILSVSTLIQSKYQNNNNNTQVPHYFTTDIPFVPTTQRDPMNKKLESLVLFEFGCLYNSLQYSHRKIICQLLASWHLYVTEEVANLWTSTSSFTLTTPASSSARVLHGRGSRIQVQLLFLPALHSAWPAADPVNGTAFDLSLYIHTLIVQRHP